MRISIASGKGGVGKSSVTSSLAELFSRDFKITLVDADAETPNLKLLFDVTWQKRFKIKGEIRAEIVKEKCLKCGECEIHCPYECIKRDADGFLYVQWQICEGCRVCQMVCPAEGAIEFLDAETGYVLLGETERFPLISSELMVGRPNSGKLVYFAKKLAQDFDSDFTLIDSAAGIGCSVVASVNDSDLVVIVVEPTPASISDAQRLSKVLKQFNRRAVVILNKAGLNDSYEDKVLKFCDESGYEFIGSLPYDRSVVKAISVGKVPVLDASSPFSKAVSSVYSRLLEVIGV